MNHTGLIGRQHTRLLLYALVLFLCTSAHAALSCQQFTFGTDGGDCLLDAVVAPDRSLYLVGETTGSFASANAGGRDIVLVHMSPSGSILWSKQVGSVAEEYAPSMTLTSDAIYVHNRQIYGTTLPLTYAELRRFDLSGNLAWTQGRSSSASLSGPMIDAAGNIRVLDRVQGVLQGTWIRQYSPDGTLISNTQLAGGVAGGLIASKDGGMLAVSSLSTVDNETGIRVYKYDSAGTPLWSTTCTVPGTVISSSLTTDAQGNIVVAYTCGTPFIFPDDGSDPQPGAQSWSLISLDPQGTLLHQMPSSSSGLVGGLTTDSTGRVYVTVSPSLADESGRSSGRCPLRTRPAKQPVDRPASGPHAPPRHRGREPQQHLCLRPGDLCRRHRLLRHPPRP